MAVARVMAKYNLDYPEALERARAQIVSSNTTRARTSCESIYRGVPQASREIQNFKASGNGLRLNHRSILGFFDDETVMLDFDNAPYKMVKKYACMAMNFHGLGGLMILKSSEKSYHVVFNRKVPWTENQRIMAWVSYVMCPWLRLSESSERALASLNLLLYLRMQCIKQSSALRTSPNGSKSSPRIVYREGDQDNRIANYLDKRRILKSVLQYESDHPYDR